MGKKLDRIEKEFKIDQLNDFKNKVNCNHGYIDVVDAFILCDLFEIYYPGPTTYLDSLKVPEQLKKMWSFLKDYEYESGKKMTSLD